MQLRRPALDGKGPILEGPTLQDVHEGTAFKDSQPSTKALPLKARPSKARPPEGPTFEGPILEGPTLQDVHEGIAFKEAYFVLLLLDASSSLLLLLLLLLLGPSVGTWRVNIH